MYKPITAKDPTKKNEVTRALVISKGSAIDILWPISALWKKSASGYPTTKNDKRFIGTEKGGILLN